MQRQTASYQTSSEELTPYWWSMEAHWMWFCQTKVLRNAFSIVPPRRHRFAYAAAVRPKKPLLQPKSVNLQESEPAPSVMAVTMLAWFSNRMSASVSSVRKECRHLLHLTFQLMSLKSSDVWSCGMGVCLISALLCFHNSSSIAVLSFQSSKLSSPASSTLSLFRFTTACWFWVMLQFTLACQFSLSYSITMLVSTSSWSIHLYMLHCRREDRSQSRHSWFGSSNLSSK